MAWTTPKTWTNEPLVASDLNTHLRDNLEALKNPPSYSFQATAGYSTTSTTPVLVDSSNMNETITLESVRNVLVGINGTIANSGSSDIYFSLERNGVTVMDSIVTGGGAGVYRHLALEFLFEDLSIGLHTFAVKWRVTGNTGTLYANRNHFYIQGL